jgi:hypothetical protein
LVQDHVTPRVLAKTGWTASPKQFTLQHSQT